jgi:hypothetical protein
MSNNGKSLRLLPPGRIRAIKCDGGIFSIATWNSDGFVVRFHVVSPEGIELEKPFVYSISPENTWGWVDEALGIVEVHNHELELVPDTRP